jgi:hypothetical protein
MVTRDAHMLLVPAPDRGCCPERTVDEISLPRRKRVALTIAFGV